MGLAGEDFIIAWIVFNYHGLGPLVKLNQSLTENGHIQLLIKLLRPFIDLNSSGIFQDDNQSYLRAQTSRDWYEERSRLPQ
ncbi:hypothetical protein TNCV_3584261 [Trichonephila clavipes]|nr:hypothetical protein TNCV_3584261 [Trichonephila clavipes]